MLKARKRGLTRIAGSVLLLAAVWMSPKYVPRESTGGAVFLAWGIISFAVALALLGVGEVASGRPIEELEEWWRKLAWYYRIPVGLILGVSALVPMVLALTELLIRFLHVKF